VDLLGSGPHDDETLKTIFTELCRLETEPDGLTFLPESVVAAPIREEAAYAGTRVILEARLESARIRVQVDIGFGDVVTPAPEEITFPALLDFPAPHLRAHLATLSLKISSLDFRRFCKRHDIRRDMRAGRPRTQS
jgi:hypothetical protein